MPLGPGEKLLLASRPVTAKFATIHCCDCVPSSLCVFLFCMCAMENTWKATLLEAGVISAVAEKVVETYANETVFQSCFRTETDLDKFAKSVLLGMTPPIASEEDWSFHPVTGALRRVRESLLAPSTVAASLLPLLPFSQPAVAISHRLSEVDREGMIKKFGDNYPGVHLHPGVLPALPYLQMIQQQCKTKSWAWTPWRKVLSEEAMHDVQSRRGVRKRDMAELD